MSGEFVTELPQSGREATTRDWDALVLKCQANPGKVLLAAEAIPETTVKSLRQRKRAPFVADGGSLTINQRNVQYDAALDKNVADVYFTWVEHNKEEEN